IVGRTTMISVAPILLMAIWLRNRQRRAAATGLLVAAAFLPYLPFLIADPKALVYALYGSYDSLMKGFVWTSTTWARDAIGVTGMLLRAPLGRLVDPIHLLSLGVISLLAWRGLGRGQRPLPWMGLALLAFSMTTLWTVHYIYLDVFLLLAAGAIAETDWFA